MAPGPPTPDCIWQSSKFAQGQSGKQPKIVHLRIPNPIWYLVSALRYLSIKWNPIVLHRQPGFFSILPWHEMKASILSLTFTHKAIRCICYLTTSTAPGRTLGSLPIMETLAANEPSMLKTTHSIPRGKTVRKASPLVWSPLRGNTDMRCGLLIKLKICEFNLASSRSPSALGVRVYECQLNAPRKLSPLTKLGHFGYITSNLWKSHWLTWRPF